MIGDRRRLSGTIADHRGRSPIIGDNPRSSQTSASAMIGDEMRHMKTRLKNALNQCNKNPKEMWKTINKLTNKKSKTAKITELKVNGESITKPDSIADALNTHFNDINPYLASNLPDSNTIPENYISLVIQALNLVKFCQLISIEYFQCPKHPKLQDMIEYLPNC